MSDDHVHFIHLEPQFVQFAEDLKARQLVDLVFSSRHLLGLTATGAVVSAGSNQFGIGGLNPNALRLTGAPYRTVRSRRIRHDGRGHGPEAGRHRQYWSRQHTQRRCESDGRLVCVGILTVWPVGSTDHDRLLALSCYDTHRTAAAH